MRRPLQSVGAKVAKVKKAAGVTGERNIKGKIAKSKKKAAPKPAKGVEKRARRTTTKRASKRTATKTVKAKAKKARAKKGGLKVVRGRKVVSDAPVVTVAVKALDPLRKCGPNTTVQLMYRVDESVDGRRTAHLVFFDRHGWYCEHGRTCPAVGHARKHGGQIARVS
jgi:hypothetical protein